MYIIIEMLMIRKLGLNITDDTLLYWVGLFNVGLLNFISDSIVVIMCEYWA